MGIASWEGKIATYKEFAQNVIPRIKNLGKSFQNIIYKVEFIERAKLNC